MDSLSYKTISLSKENVEKNWFLVDAKNQVLGRVASDIAKIIRGKHKAYYTPHVDCGDNVIVINADHIRLTGKKWTDKKYVRHTGYPGGQRVSTPREIKAKSASILIEKAVQGMLPKNRLGRKIIKNLYVYNSKEHPHEAQQPKEIKF
ncbi:MAG TPA: 50S ribosomal protein L13 [Cyclobacteriaceae bacterium]